MHTVNIVMNKVLFVYSNTIKLLTDAHYLRFMAILRN